ncbi:unnamed protein product [Brassica oleracea]|uniref:(rape) hypothetical protein n=2 Tax=Brassica TaxID=3705 RepID=A0A816Q274_BRANA|nr:unnamed protein product [Brassica napus]
MVRGKIELKKIENANRLQVSFTNRRKVLMKKANDLSILCDADVALIVFSNTGDVLCSSMEQILSRYGYIAADHRQRQESMCERILFFLFKRLKRIISDLQSFQTILLNQVETSRLQEKIALEENQLLRKQIESMVGRGSSGPQVDPESSSSNDKEDHHSDTSLQLGWGKRKKLKIERPAITLEVQVSSD